MNVCLSVCLPECLSATWPVLSVDAARACVSRDEFPTFNASHCRQLRLRPNQAPAKRLPTPKRVEPLPKIHPDDQLGVLEWARGEGVGKKRMS